MKASSRILRLILTLPLILNIGICAAFNLRSTPPGNRLAMNLVALGTAPISFIGYQPAPWSAGPETAMSLWNQTGVGVSLDHSFFTVLNSNTGDACSSDGVNKVIWSTNFCGFGFGSALAITTTWSVGGLAVEVDMNINSSLSWNGYTGAIRPAAGGGNLHDIFRVTLHEIGHAIGLKHPDDVGQSVAAIMNSRESDTYILQPDDIAGAHAIAWGTIQPPSNSVIEYIDTIDFPNAPGGHFFYSNDPTEIQIVDAGTAGHFVRTGQSFKTGGAKQLCRFYGSIVPGPNSHFFTIVDSECSYLKSIQRSPTPTSIQQWNYEGLVFSEFPPVTDSAGRPVGCSAGTIPVYRYYNNAYTAQGKNPWDSNHRYGTNKAGLDAFAATYGWGAEGIVFCTSP